MLKTFWLKMIFPICVSIFASMYILDKTTVKFPLILNAVPRGKWSGISKSLVIMTETISKYHLLPFVFPCLIIGIGLTIYLNKKATIEIRNKVLRTLSIVTIILTLLIVFWFEYGGVSLLDQMTKNMGLGS